MAFAANKSWQAYLPTQNRAHETTPAELLAGMHPRLQKLGARIAMLPDVHPLKPASGPAPRAVEYVMEKRRNLRQAARLCSIGAAGVVLFAISPTDRARVLNDGRGEARTGGMRLFTPRSEKELDSVWRLVLLAHESLAAPARREGGRNSSPLAANVRTGTTREEH